MAISLGNKTKLTSDAEKIFVEEGGENPDKTLTEDELREALVNAITLLSENNSPFLIKLYKHIAKMEDIPPLESFKMES